jgi:hypothetical protein
VDPFVDQICEAICGSLRAHVDRQARRLPPAPGARASTLTQPRTTTPKPPTAATRRRRT